MLCNHSISNKFNSPLNLRSIHAQIFFVNVFMVSSSYLYLYLLNYFSSVSLLYILGLVKWIPLMFQKLLFCIINFIEASFNDTIIWFHVSFSLFYIVICIDFALEWIFFSVIWHALGINDNLVINIDFKYHHPDIIGDSVELFHSYCRCLDGPGLSRKEQHDRQIYYWVRMFSFLLPSL